MKIKLLGRLLLVTLLTIAAGFTLALSLIISQYDAALKTVNATYLETALPLRQIDANTKDLRFHLLASFMHDPELEVHKYHTHPLSLHTAAIQSVMDENKRLWAQIDRVEPSNPHAKDLAALKTLYEAYYQKGMGPGITAVTAENWNGIIASVTATLVDYVQFEKTLQQKVSAMQKWEEQQALDLSSQRRSILLAVGLLAALTLGIAGFVTWRTTTRAVVRMSGAASAAAAMATGDLTSRLDTSGADEASDVLRAMSDMQRRLQGLVSNIQTSVEVIRGAASDVNNGNDDLSSRTEQQASALEETAATVEQFNSSVRQNADNAIQANRLAASASDVAAKGGNVVSEAVNTMQAINDSAKKIVDIIGVIDGIAFQTNILALNAAVEAARAGENGRGFAVVASEVRNLAQRSAAAAKEIKLLINSSVERVDAGSRLVDQAGETMKEIVASTKRVADIIGEISNAGEEQASGIQQIHQAVTSLDQTTQQNATLVSEAAAAAQELHSQADHLSNAVAIFKLSASRAPNATPLNGPGATPAKARLGFTA
ncbi:methyl-accepting chemotaxis protein [Undibacterium sp. Di26W]|uniref:methyl-accepting chemotaxis protein n=1 Tax=Undibacterium sp. Di26W TaxID=3413035 RepID=UPI003BF3C79B